MVWSQQDRKGHPSWVTEQQKPNLSKGISNCRLFVSRFLLSTHWWKTENRSPPFILSLLPKSQRKAAFFFSGSFYKYLKTVSWLPQGFWAVSFWIVKTEFSLTFKNGKGKKLVKEFRIEYEDPKLFNTALRMPNYNSPAVGEGLRCICVAWVTVLITNWGDQLTHVGWTASFRLLCSGNSVNPFNKPQPFTPHLERIGILNFVICFGHKVGVRNF